MKQKIFIIAGIVLVLLALAIGVGAYVLTRPAQGPAPSGQQSGGNPFGFSTGAGSIASNGTRTLGTLASSTLSVPDFTEGKTAAPISADPRDVQYELTPYPPYEPGRPFPTHTFDVQFNPVHSQFIVTLNQEPLGASRTAAEAYLRETLKLSDAELCSLAVIVGVPYSVNQALSRYQNLGMSFCPGSMRLP